MKYQYFNLSAYDDKLRRDVHKIGLKGLFGIYKRRDNPFSDTIILAHILRIAKEENVSFPEKDVLSMERKVRRGDNI